VYDVGCVDASCTLRFLHYFQRAPGKPAALALRPIRCRVASLAGSVVLEELYADASERDRRASHVWSGISTNAKRILVPNLGDWTQAGKVLARLAGKYHYERMDRDD